MIRLDENSCSHELEAIRSSFISLPPRGTNGESAGEKGQTIPELFDTGQDMDCNHVITSQL